MAAIVSGTILSNLCNSKSEEQEKDDHKNSDEQPLISFTMSFAIVGFAIAVGWFILTGLQKIELLVVEKDGFRIAKYVPLFPVAMIGGLIIQLLADKWNLGQYIVRRDINKISGFALDLLIVAAIGSLSLKMITDQWETL